MSQIVCQLDQLSSSAYVSRESQELEEWGQLLGMAFLVMIEVLCGCGAVKYAWVLRCLMLVVLVQLLMVVDEHVMGRFQRLLVDKIRKL